RAAEFDSEWLGRCVVPLEPALNDLWRTPTLMSTLSPSLAAKTRQAREKLDAQVREIIAWHFDPANGTPFWLEKAKSFNFNPLKAVKGLDALKRSGHSEDDWLRGGPVRRWVPKAYHDKPIYVFETGGTTGIPKSRMVVEDHWIDYELFSDTLPDKYFPKGSNWLMLGPSGPRRLRLAGGHPCQYRAGLLFWGFPDPRLGFKLTHKR